MYRIFPAKRAQNGRHPSQQRGSGDNSSFELLQTDISLTQDLWSPSLIPYAYVFARCKFFMPEILHINN